MRGRSRVLVVSILTLGALWVPASAHAHPLGNFTINTSAALVMRAGDVLVDYVVDMAEIPAFQERAKIDVDADGSLSPEEAAGYRGVACEALRGGLHLQLDGKPVRLGMRESYLSLPAGQAGLQTLRLTCLFRVPLASGDTHAVVFEDLNYADRLGWREVTAVGDHATVIRSDVPSESASNRLLSYP